jgi:benzoyl-CoA reductase/2-hydroxyglutaryl-CoA dehydratase subunit BcrC/BadD/HgdB
LIDTPFVYHEEAADHAINFVVGQLEDAIPIAERVAGETLIPQKMEAVGHLSKTAVELWLEILERNKHQPAPISVIDQFIQMAPIVELRGDPATVDFYAAMLNEVDERISHGIGAVREEKKRLLWDNLPIWYRLRYLAETLGKHGVSLVASTYTNAWGELAHLIDPTQGLMSMARAYTHVLLNRGTGHGVILHSDRSCKPYSIGQMDQRDKLIKEYGKPALLLEADHNDSRCFAEKQADHRLAAFIEVLERDADPQRGG